MRFKLAFFVLISIQICWAAFIITASPSSDESFDTTIERFRTKFMAFPCANKTIVHRIFNIMNFALNPKYAQRSERDAAKIDWLHLMVIGNGNNSNVSEKRFRIILKKTIGAYSEESLPILEKKLKLNERLLKKYLSPSQIRRFNLYLREMVTEMISSDLDTFNRYFFGFPIGLALGVPEDDIDELLENDAYGDNAIDYLGRLANLVCEFRHPNAAGHRNNDNIIRDLRRALETLLNRSQAA